MAEKSIQFKIGRAGVHVTSDLADVINDLRRLYDCAPMKSDESNVIGVEIKRTTSSLKPGRYSVGIGKRIIGQHLKRREVFPYVEWAINLRHIETRNEYVQLHAATLAWQGQGVIFAAASGSGKSTLAAGLMARRWQYLCDEFALIDPESNSLHAFPKALCIKSGSYATVSKAGLTFSRRRDHIKNRKGPVGYIRPIACQDAVSSPPVRHIVFPEYTPGAKPELSPLTPPEALMELVGCVFNRRHYADQALGVLTRVVEGATCYRLVSGELTETCDLLERELFGVHNSPATVATQDTSDVADHDRRRMLRRSAKLAYVSPLIVALANQKAFAAGSNLSGICSTGLDTGENCTQDADCCSGDCDFGVCE